MSRPLLQIVEKHCHIDTWTDGYVDGVRAASGTEARPGPRPRLAEQLTIQQAPFSFRQSLTYRDRERKSSRMCWLLGLFATHQNDSSETKGPA